MVSGIRLTAPADRSMPQSERVSNVRLSVATTETGGVAISCVPLLSSMVTVDASPAESDEADEVPPQAVRARAEAPSRAPRRSFRDDMGVPSSDGPERPAGGTPSLS